VTDWFPTSQRWCHGATSNVDTHGAEDLKPQLRRLQSTSRAFLLSLLWSAWHALSSLMGDRIAEVQAGVNCDNYG